MKNSLTVSEQTAHSKIGASSMYRWSACPGSINLCDTLPPQPSSAYAAEGNLAHDIAADILMGKQEPKCDEEMREAIQVYLDFCGEVTHGVPLSNIHVEHSFDMSDIYPGLYGTADYVVFNPTSKVLHVIDYKHGAGIPVDPTDNPQLMYYGLGALHTLKYPAATVMLTVVQPRCPNTDGPIRSWELSAIELIDFEVGLVEFAKQTESPNAPLNAGDHCRFCPAAGTCKEIHNKAQEMAKSVFAPQETYDVIRLGKCLEWLPRLEAWCKSVREFAYNEAIQGRMPPGHKLVAKRATRKWVDPDAVLDFMEQKGFMFHEAHELKIKSPAQMEKLFKTKEEKEALFPFIKKESSGNTLVHVSDKRPAITNDPKQVFGKV